MGNKVAITVTPGDAGILKVTCDGEVVFDRHSEDGKYPEFTRMRGIKAAISDYVKAAAV